MERMMKRMTVVALASVIAFGMCANLGSQERSDGKAQSGKTWTNPIDGSVLVWIPGGRFRMGSDRYDKDERPSHQVTVEGFWLGKYEVTNRQYDRFLRKEDYPEPGYWNDEEINQPDKPVTAVKFYEVLGYCEWARLRLPTEAEWEYAASCGGRFEYGTADGTIGNDLANYWGTGGRDTWLETPAPVGSFAPNAFGLYDMAGNVWEWTSSIYLEYPYMRSDGRENLATRRHRVMRGGSWQFGPEYCRVSHRHHFAMHLRYDYVGFRVAKSEGK